MRRDAGNNDLRKDRTLKGFDAGMRLCVRVLNRWIGTARVCVSKRSAVDVLLHAIVPFATEPLDWNGTRLRKQPQCRLCALACDCAFVLYVPDVYWAYTGLYCVVRLLR